ncbi:hypothetical protein [Roseovarius sp.]|uniref:hypothetical protein n=1 Tax=Roseovarius sp. TaxID=1486281 RepID=UPI0025E8E3D1|nr:hypothetical protein [Roseovarius sp.]
MDEGNGRIPNDIGGTSAAVLDGVLCGFGDEFLAALSATLDLQPDGHSDANFVQFDRPIRDRFDTALTAIREEQARFAIATPGKTAVTEIAGLIIAPGKGTS